MSEEQRLFIPGPAGQLEAIHTTPEEGQADRIAIICHPHPLHEGTMNNKVVTLLAKTFNKLGFETLRFNYRGVGKSEGHYGDRVGEIEDLKAVKAWAEPKSQFCLSGFSFGAFIAASVANESENVSQLITVAPAIHHSDFNELTDIHAKWLLIAAEDDEIVPFTEIRQFVEHPPSPLTFVSLPGASHFFHGKLRDLQQVIESNISD